MRPTTTRLGTALILVAIAGCARPPAQTYDAFTADADLLHAAVWRLTEVMMETITSPPVSSRTYTYTSIAAYEAIRHDHPEYRSFAGQLNGLTDVPVPDRQAGEYLLPLSGAVAFLTVAEPLVFRPAEIATYRDSLVAAARASGIERDVLYRSVSYGEEVGRHILAWAAKDNITEARALPRFVVENEPGRWLPTPPAYMQGVEPNWAVIRPFVLASADQFRPAPPLEYDMTEGSPFHREVIAVYEAGVNLTPEQREIAAFWDCNPYALKIEGHFMYADKKITPGGHWMGIAEIALKQTNADVMRATEVYSKLGMALADGFISTWEEKYRSNLVRPETVINMKVDPMWRPVLQTPPFPEYTSGHSVISTAAAEVMTALFGDDFAYDDTTEVPFGLPVRSFNSFREAAAEAAISRLYGGIHYPMAIEHGVEQGQQVGQHIVSRVQTRGEAFAAN
jgi:hypothetical protein